MSFLRSNLEQLATAGMTDDDLEDIIRMGGMRKLCDDFAGHHHKLRTLVKDVGNFITGNEPIDLLEAIGRATQP